MPNIIFDGPKLTIEQKKALVENFTSQASNITRISAEAFVVIIKENAPENIGVGGTLLSERRAK